MHNTVLKWLNLIALKCKSEIGSKVTFYIIYLYACMVTCPLVINKPVSKNSFLN